MKNIYLTSSIAHTGEYIGKSINSNKKHSLAFITTASETETENLDWLDNDRDGLIYSVTLSFSKEKTQQKPYGF